MGFNVRVECESLVKICEEGEFMIGLRLTTRERSHEKHMLESEQSHGRLVFVSDLQNSLPRAFLKCVFLIPLPTLYKPTLPTKL